MYSLWLVTYVTKLIYILIYIYILAYSKDITNIHRIGKPEALVDLI